MATDGGRVGGLTGPGFGGGGVWNLSEGPIPRRPSTAASFFGVRQPWCRFETFKFVCVFLTLMGPDDADDSSGVGLADDAAEVMASVDAAELVIADVSREDAWLSVEADQAPILREWC